MSARIYMTANGQTGVSLLPAAAAGGSANVIGISNGYNRVTATAIVLDSSGSYSYSTGAWRPYNGASSNVNNRVTFVDGLQQSQISAETVAVGYSSVAGYNFQNGVCLDSVSATPGGVLGYGSLTNPLAMTAFDAFHPQLGVHFVQAMEKGNGGGGSTQTFFANSLFSLRVTLDY